MQNRTERGGWTRAQIDALGERWDAEHRGPVSGWIDRSVGRKLSIEQSRAFEDARHINFRRRRALAKARDLFGGGTP